MPTAHLLGWQKLTPHQIFSRHTILKKEWESHQGLGGDTKGLARTPVTPLPLAPPPRVSCQETFEVGIVFFCCHLRAPLLQLPYMLQAGTTLHCASTHLTFLSEFRPAHFCSCSLQRAPDASSAPGWVRSRTP